MNSFWIKIKEIWNSMSTATKAFIALIGSAVVAICYHQIVIDLLVRAANKSFGKATEKTVELKKEEDTTKTEAAILIQQSNDLKTQETNEVITPDWNQK